MQLGHFCFGLLVLVKVGYWYGIILEVREFWSLMFKRRSGIQRVFVYFVSSLARKTGRDLNLLKFLLLSRFIEKNHFLDRSVHF